MSGFLDRFVLIRVFAGEKVVCDICGKIHSTDDKYYRDRRRSGVRLNLCIGCYDLNKENIKSFKGDWG